MEKQDTVHEALRQVIELALSARSLLIEGRVQAAAEMIDRLKEQAQAADDELAPFVHEEIRDGGYE
jgi:hypothetical protein